ncbi:hypothetical protein E2C01_049304 [Portunus trituberculatus]|uniref:Uncharacterized protein n=1 Tax=Portunus trituberculatus TaxID=210409 RepID=A0A5B7G5U7_PORTR|nr:hypothetical protein [Portunus trituberculatus]
MNPNNIHNKGYFSPDPSLTLGQHLRALFTMIPRPTLAFRAARGPKRASGVKRKDISHWRPKQRRYDLRLSEGDTGSMKSRYLETMTRKFDERKRLGEDTSRRK